MSTTTKIGTHEFIRLSAPPQLPATQLAVFARAGVDGHTLQDIGRRGEPFEVDSFVDVASKNAAFEKFRQYQLLISQGAQSVQWSGEILENWSMQAVVLGVLLLRITKLEASSGGLNAPSEAGLWARWTLLPV